MRSLNSFMRSLVSFTTNIPILVNKRMDVGVRETDLNLRVSVTEQRDPFACGLQKNVRSATYMIKGSRSPSWLMG